MTAHIIPLGLTLPLSTPHPPSAIWYDGVRYELEYGEGRTIYYN